LADYFKYYHKDRTHLSLEKDTPYGRPIETRPTDKSKVIALPRVGGLHHRYIWKKAAWEKIFSVLHEETNTSSPMSNCI